jgi:hypothetical protein
LRTASQLPASDDPDIVACQETFDRSGEFLTLTEGKREKDRFHKLPSERTLWLFLRVASQSVCNTAAVFAALSRGVQMRGGHYFPRFAGDRRAE